MAHIYLFVLKFYTNFLIPEIKLELNLIGFDSGKESSSFFCLKVLHINFHSIGFYIFLNFEISTVQMEGFLLSNPEKKEVTLYQVRRNNLVKLLKVLDGQNSLSNNFYSGAA
jgi:hypothetical protein